MQQMTMIQQFAIWALPVLFAITLHEVAHGWVAYRFGDPTAKVLGRLTINPVKHIDLLGTIIIPSILLYLGGFIFGWAKPVPIVWRNLKNPRRDMALVSIAGPFTNFLMALAWAGIAKLGVFLTHTLGAGAIAVIYMGKAGIIINIALMILNVLPVPPLDGSRVLASLLPPELAFKYNQLQAYGFIFLLVLLATGVLSNLISPPIIAVEKFILNLFGIP